MPFPMLGPREDAGVNGRPAAPTGARPLAWGPGGRNMTIRQMCDVAGATYRTICTSRSTSLTWTRWIRFPRRRPRRVGAYDAKSRLSELLDRVEKGEEIVITRHGKPIARLVPEGGHNVAEAFAALERITARRRKMAARGVRITQDEIRAMRDEGRRS